MFINFILLLLILSEIDFLYNLKFNVKYRILNYKFLIHEKFIKKNNLREKKLLFFDNKHLLINLKELFTILLYYTILFYFLIINFKNEIIIISLMMSFLFNYINNNITIKYKKYYKYCSVIETIYNLSLFGYLFYKYFIISLNIMNI